jgi:tRNA A37 threonylcarbamoyladenosine dehydratase
MRFARTRILVGDDGLERLQQAKVAVFGLGGVGSYAVEALARAGVGALHLVDFDTLCPTNLNRQLFALESTLGRPKVDVARERVADINPGTMVTCDAGFVEPEGIAAHLPGDATHIVDAIDSVPSKVALLAECHRRGLPCIGVMGAASRLVATDVRVADISDTHQCPLAKAVRLRLRKMGIHKGVRCVYSKENRNAVVPAEDPDGYKRVIQGSISYVPAIMGLTAAGVIISDILGETWA